jgi:hypothetical protein
VHQDDIAYRLKHVIDRYPIFAGGLDTDIPAVVFRQALRQFPEIACKHGKPVSFIRSDAFAVGCRDTSDNKGFVNIDATADLIHNLESHVLPSYREI